MLRILVACGGESPEREVSLVSGAAVAKGLEVSGHEVFCEDIRSVRVLTRLMAERRADIAFIAFHGGWGEDGRIQTCLEMFGCRYTGSGPEGCIYAMDKQVTKALLARTGVPMPKGIALHRTDSLRPQWDPWFERFGKLVVKPCGCGSTVGVSIVEKKEDMEAALELAWSFDERLLVEEYIPGSEVAITVWEDERGVRAFPPVEIRPKEGYYDYRHKYTKGCTEYFCPGNFEESIVQRMTRCAVKTFRALHLQVYARVDLRLSPEGHPFVLEANTVPGMTDTSLVPKAAATVGMSFPELVDRIVRNSMVSKRRY